MTIEVTRQAIERMMAEAGRAYPHECCGLLLGEGERIAAIRPAANVHPEPARFFEIDPRALIDAHRTAREGGAELIGYYHSHPFGSPEPSATDRAQSSGDGRLWAIIGQQTIRLWRDTRYGFEPLSYVAFDG